MGSVLQVEQSLPSSVPVPSLRTNFRWTFAGNITYALCQWGMLSVLARLGNPLVVGQFALGLAIGAPVYMFTNLQLRAVQATDARSEYEFSDYFTLRFLITLLGWLVIAATVLWLHYDKYSEAVILLVGTSKAIECLSDVVAGLLQKHERLDRVAISLAVRGICSLVVFSVVFWVSRNLVSAVFAIVGTWLAVLLFYDIPWASRFAGSPGTFLRFRIHVLKKLFRVSLPLGITMMLISLNVNIPRYFLQHYRGLSDLGIFASLAYMVVAVNLIVTALGQSVSTRLSVYFADNNLHAFRVLVAKLAGLGVLVVFFGVPVALLLGRVVLTLFYGRTYGEYSNLLAIIVATAGITTIGSFLGYGITAARRFKEQVPLICASTGTTLVGALFLVPRYGLVGASVCLLLSAVVLVVAAFVVLRSSLRDHTLKGA